MRPGCVKVETSGSYWWLDDARGEYLRLPKEEKPRERPEWSDERAGVLRDAVWHPMTGWRIDHPGGWHDIEPGLMIDTPDGLRTWAPNAVVVSGSAPEVAPRQPPTGALIIALEDES